MTFHGVQFDAGTAISLLYLNIDNIHFSFSVKMLFYLNVREQNNIVYKNTRHTVNTIIIIIWKGYRKKPRWLIWICFPVSLNNSTYKTEDFAYRYCVLIILFFNDWRTSDEEINTSFISKVTFFLAIRFYNVLTKSLVPGESCFRFYFPYKHLKLFPTFKCCKIIGSEIWFYDWGYFLR